MSLHTNLPGLLGVSTITFLVLSFLIAIMPAIEVQNVEPPEGKPVLTEEQMLGRDLYLKEGCATCHTQFVRDLPVDKPYGRGSIAEDYAGEKPPLLGTQRTGPDLSNVGIRQPSDVWNLIHLYNPRTVVPKSVMPAYPWYFELKDQAATGDVEVPVPSQFVPEGKVVIAKPEAIAMVRYLQTLIQTEIKP